MIKSLVFFIQELIHRLTQHPFLAVKKALSPATWKKLTSFVVGETVQPTYQPVLPPEMTSVLADYAAASEKPPFYSAFVSTHPRLRLPVHDQPRVSVIVPVYNQVLNTLYCLDSLIRHSGNVAFEVILADDGSYDETQKLDADVDNLRVVRAPRNLGFLGNCNHAARAARGEYLAFLNNDTYVQPGWLTELVLEIERDPTVGLVGSKLVYPDGTLQEAGGIIWNDASGANYGRNDNATKPQYNFVRDVDYVSGAAILIRRSLFETIGGFDPRFAPAYYEDTDLAFEVRKRGLRVRYQPFSVVVHFEGVSHGKDASSGIKKYQSENREKFLQKWQTVLATKHKAPESDWFHARERIPPLRTILVLDRKTPAFDQDAGSRNTWLYTVLLYELGYKIVFVGDDFRGEQPYVEILQRKGIEVLFGGWFRNNIRTWLDANGHHFDYVFVNRPEIASKYWTDFQKHPELKIVYHGHDLASWRTKRQFEVTGDHKQLAESAKWEKLERKLFAGANTVLTVSQDEKSVIDGWTGNPSKTYHLPLYFYDSPLPPAELATFADRTGFLFVGGFTHAPNVDAALWFVSEILPRLPGRPAVTLVGAHAPESIRRLVSDQVTHWDYVSDEHLARLYSQVRLVVAPLRFGAGVKGKTIEAFRHHVPLVGTATAYEGLGLDLALFPVADSARAFADQILRLTASEDEWLATAKRGEGVILEQFTRDRAVAVMEKVFT